MTDRTDAINGGEDDMVAALNAALDEQEGVTTEAPAEKEPAEEVEVTETAEEKQERIRDEKGRFAKAEQPEAEASAEGQDQTKPEPAAPSDTQAAPGAETGAHRPPPGWSPASKVAFDALPDSVKADIAKREAEVNEGFKRYAGLGEYVAQAERNGTNLATVVRDYHAVEQEIRRDFLGGIEYICRRFGVDPQALTTALSSRYGSGFNPPAGQDDGASQTRQFDPQAIIRQAEQSARDAARQEFEERTLVSQIEAFKTDPKNKFFDNVKSQMAALINSGQATAIQDAYDQACWLNKDVREILLNEAKAISTQNQTIAQKAQAAAQAKQAAKSITGAPSHGAKPAKVPEKSIIDELSDNWDSMTGAV